MTRRVVISAVNFTEGGPLTVLRDCLRAAASQLEADWEIIALVHDRRLIDEPRVRLVEIADAKRSWLGRLKHEWLGFGKLSRQWQPDLWLSLHDITPRVSARRQAVYCHNPSPFYRLPWREARLEPPLFLFNRLYRYLYRAFIRRNTWVIVQQEWLRVAFQDLFGQLPIVVAHPTVHISATDSSALLVSSRKVVFLYPALPRVFKNIETVLAAAEQLAAASAPGFELRVTLSGNENSYAQWLYGRFGHLECVRFIGRQNREEMADQYREATAVLFPSKLETWGLPISEAKVWRKPLLVAALPYAFETVGNCDHVQFLPAEDAQAWSDAMRALVEQTWKPSPVQRDLPAEPFVKDWPELWQFLVKGL